MASKAATLGDPRRPQEVRSVSILPPTSSDDSLCMTILIMALSTAVSGMMFQSKVMVWGAVFLIMSGFSHAPYDSPDATRMVTLIMTTTMWAFAQLYFRHFLNPGAAASPPAATASPGVQG